MRATKSTIDEAYKQAVAVLRRCATPYGFRASGVLPGYPQIWARDSMITSLGAALTGEPDLFAAVRASLDTLGRQQSPFGLDPVERPP